MAGTFVEGPRRRGKREFPLAPREEVARQGHERRTGRFVRINPAVLSGYILERGPGSGRTREISGVPFSTSDTANAQRVNSLGERKCGKTGTERSARRT